MTFHPRRYVALLVAATVLVVGAGCSSSIDDAARVGRVSITRDDFDGELRALLDNEDFRTLLTEQGVEPAGDHGAVTAEVTATWLGERIRQLAVDAEFEARELEVTDALRDQARSNLESAFGGPEVFGGFSASLRDTLVERSARAIAVARSLVADVIEPTEADVRAFYDENVGNLCPTGREVAHILVATRAEADTVVAQLATGADFADLASEQSIDTGSGANGGELGCLRDGSFVEEFQQAAAEAPLGEPFGPVETEFGFHVLLVTTFVPPTFAEAHDQILDQLREQAESEATTASQQRLQEVLGTRLADDEVWVAARYGRWVNDAQGPRVEPPQSPDVRDGRSGTTLPLPSELPGTSG